MRYFLFILIMPLAIFCHGQKNIENEKYFNFLFAIHNNTTIGYFTVVKIKNLKTGKVKEICTSGNFVSGALHSEINAGYDSDGAQKVLNYIKGKDQYFELKNDKALYNVGFNTYSEKLLDTIRKSYNFKEIEKKILKNGQFRIRLPHGKMEAFAHILFNMGYMTGENMCWGGELFYVDRNKNLGEN